MKECASFSIAFGLHYICQLHKLRKDALDQTLDVIVLGMKSPAQNRLLPDLVPSTRGASCKSREEKKEVVLQVLPITKADTDRSRS